MTANIFPMILAGALSMQANVLDTSTQPVRLSIEQVEGAARLLVEGASDRAVEVDYELDVTSRSGGGTNRAHQRGVARLKPGEPMVLIRLSVSQGPRADWEAKLTVTPRDGTAYSQRLSADDLTE